MAVFEAQAVESCVRIVRRMRLERLVFGIAWNHARVVAVIVSRLQDPNACTYF